MKKKQASLALPELICHVLHERELPAGVDWNRAYSFGVQHHLTGFVYRAIVGRDDVPQEAVQRIENGYFSAAGEQTRQEHYAELLFGSLREKKIRFLPMSGYVMRRVYPQPKWRVSSDLDVTVEEERFDDACAILEEQNFAREEEEGVPYITYILDHVVIRIHHLQEDTNWDTLLTDDGLEHRYTDEDYYLRILRYTKKRLLDGECGVRAVLDLYMYRSAKTEMDFASLSEQIASEGLTKLEESVVQLGEAWFGEAEMTDDMMLLGSYITSSGTLADFEAEEKTHPWRSIFPRYRTMKRRYPFLRRVPLMLPVMWVVRWFHLLFSRGHDRYAEELSCIARKRSAVMEKRVKEILGFTE